MTGSYRWVALGMIWVSHTIYFLNYMTVGTLAPLIESDMGISPTYNGFMSSAVSTGSMVSQIPVGVLSDRYGAR